MQSERHRAYAHPDDSSQCCLAIGQLAYMTQIPRAKGDDGSALPVCQFCAVRCLRKCTFALCENLMDSALGPRNPRGIIRAAPDLAH